PGGCPGGPALRPAHLGGGPDPGLPADSGRLDRPVAGLPGVLRLSLHHRCHDLHQPAVRGAHGAAVADLAGQGIRRGRAHAGRQQAADLLARDPADAGAGADHRRRAILRAQPGRVRRGGDDRRQHAVQDRGQLADDLRASLGIRLSGRRGHRLGDPAGFPGSAVHLAGGAEPRPSVAAQEMKKPDSWQQWLLIGLGLAVVALILLVPLVLIFTRALSGGWDLLVQNLSEDYMQHALMLTVLVALATVPINLVFGICLAWCVTRYDFRGRRLLSTLIDNPYAVSPVGAGLCYLVIYGIEGVIGQWFYDRDSQLMFAWAGIVMVTVFVTAPYVARILIPTMQSQGSEEETAALTLGANGWQIFRHVTLPNIKWALLYAVVVTNARAVGEFGAVSVVSGTIMNQTLTLPLLVDQLNNDYKTAAAFTAAALLACMALLTLFLKTFMEWRQRQTLAKAAAS